MLFNGRNNAIKFVDGYSSMIHDAKRKAILTPKQMPQILSIAFVQVKAVNTPENLMKYIESYIKEYY